MPIVSQAQRGAMYAAAKGNSTLGIPKSVGAEFVATDKPGKLPVRKKPPEKTKRMFAQGRISQKAMDKAEYRTDSDGE